METEREKHEPEPLEDGVVCQLDETPLPTPEEERERLEREERDRC